MTTLRHPLALKVRNLLLFEDRDALGHLARRCLSCQQFDGEHVGECRIEAVLMLLDKELVDVPNFGQQYASMGGRGEPPGGWQ